MLPSRQTRLSLPARPPLPPQSPPLFILPSHSVSPVFSRGSSLSSSSSSRSFVCLGVSTFLLSSAATLLFSPHTRSFLRFPAPLSSPPPLLPSSPILRSPSRFLSPAPAPSPGQTQRIPRPLLSPVAAMSHVSIGLPAQGTISLAAKKEHRATVVFLHGLGDTGAGWADVPPMLNLQHVKWVFPSAPIKPVTLNGGMPCPSWFDIFGLDAESREDREGIDKAARYLAQILKKEGSLAPAGAKIIVGGFSQGGALSLHLTARKFVGTFLDGSTASDVPLDGTVALSSWLPLYSTLKGSSFQSAEAAASHPLLMCHGEADPLVRFNFGKLSSQELQALGFSALKFKSYPGLPHSACPEEFQDLKQWLETVTSV